MIPEYNKENLEDEFRTLGITMARHLVSVQISSGKLEESDLLSKSEINLCTYHNMIIPMPQRAILGTKYVDPDLWNIRVVDDEIRKGHTVYVLTGVFDVFTGGHWSLVYQANLLAEKTNGVVVARIESDEYVKQYKKREAIFPVEYRLGWFNGLPVRWVTDYPTSQGSSQSWNFGNELLEGGPQGVDMRKSLVFVLPKSDGFGAEQEKALKTREEQIKDSGFGVVRLSSVVHDVSSSGLIENFKLKPLRHI